MYKLTLNRVHDTVRITEGGEALTLKVDDDPMRMVTALRQAQQELSGLTGEATEEAQHAAARHFAAAIFGEAQADALLQFYRGDAASTINVCGQYFSKRLNKLIIKAQKKSK